jgi:hypothetical protein
VVIEERIMMTMPTVEVRLILRENVAHKLRDMAQVQGVTEEDIVEQALDVMGSIDDTSSVRDYWFSVGAMREDWDAMPDDWIADGVGDAL